MGGRAIAAPPPIPGSSQMKMQFVPASHGQNTLGTDVPRIIRHDGAKNRVGRVPGTRTGAADLDYEGNVYTEKRVMWETLSPGQRVSTSDLQCVLICKYVINEINTNNIQYVSKLYKTTKKRGRGGHSMLYN